MSSHVHPSVGTCPDCGKQRYTSKADAKANGRRIMRRRNRLHPYKCGGYWYIGRMPAPVKAGKITRDQIPPRRKR